MPAADLPLSGKARAEEVAEIFRRVVPGVLGAAVASLGLSSVFVRLGVNAVLPAILITGDTAPERLVEAHDSGLLILHKPVSNGRLRAAIANSLVMEGA